MPKAESGGILGERAANLPLPPAVGSGGALEGPIAAAKAFLEMKSPENACRVYKFR